MLIFGIAGNDRGHERFAASSKSRLIVEVPPEPDRAGPVSMNPVFQWRWFNLVCGRWNMLQMRHIMKNVRRFYALVVIATSLALHAVAAQRRLTKAEAERLARAALSPQTKRLPGLALEPQQKPGSKTITFDVLWANRGPGSVHVEFLVVDLETADVWEPMLCRRVSTPSLAAAQRVFRKSLKTSASEVKRSREATWNSGCFFD